MTIFRCSACGSPLTPDLTALPAVPEVSYTDEDRDTETRQAPSTVPLGHYAIEPEPWGAPYVPNEDPDEPVLSQPRGNAVVMDDGFVVSAGARNTVVIHPKDAPDLQFLPNAANSMGCCGATGDKGLNRACPCTAPVATLAADCYTPYELHLDPTRTFASQG